MDNFFTDVFNALSGDEFEEVPVSIEEFVEDFLNHPPLSENQYTIIKASSQIYTKKTLIDLYGEEGGTERYQETFNEVIAALGKGSMAPYSQVFDAQTGKWVRIDSLKDRYNGTVVGYSDGELVHEYSTESFYEGYGNMLRVQTQLGLSEDAYEQHEYFVWKKKDYIKQNGRRRGEPQWTPAENLNTGDRIAVGMGFDVADPKNILPSEARFLAYVIGDGSVSDQGPKGFRCAVDFGSNEQQSIRRFTDDLEDLQIPYAIQYNRGDKAMHTVRLKSPKIFRPLLSGHDMENVKAHNKKIPDAVWGSDNSILREFISALWSTDGTVYTKRTKGGQGSPHSGVVLEYCTISEQLAHDVQRALFRLGIPASLRSRIPTYTYKGKKEKGQRAYYITVEGLEATKKFANNVTLLDYKQDLLKTIIDKPMGKALIRDELNLYWDRVKSVESIGEGPYWTLTQPHTHNYVGDGLLSLNSGKDLTARISCAYVIYLLLCLNNPQKYFGKPNNDSIDVMNIAVNADQANRVFFRQFVELIKGCEWFDGKYDAKRNEVNFDKNINLISGHSEAESLEGYNVIVVVLDEISGFAEENNSGNKKAKTAEAIYNMHRASVDSRFPKEGKVILLSFPRHREDFISKRYNEVVAEKSIVEKTHTFKRDPDLPDGYEGNEFTVEWDEDHIIRYRYPRVFALKRPTWEVNPTKSIDDFTRAFDANSADALARFAAQPTPGGDNAVFKNHIAIDDTFKGTNLVDSDGVIYNGMKPDPKKEYYIHVDLAQKHDRCAVAMAHVEKFVTVEMGGTKIKETHPTVRLDALRWWQPNNEQTVDFKWVTDFITQLSGLGYNIKMVTLDRWNSLDVRNFLESRGLKTDLLSVGNDQYIDLMSIMYDQRLLGPDVPELKNELKQLQWIKGKIDHPRSGFNDLSDASAGAVFNAVKHTARPRNNVVEVHTLRDLYKKEREEKWSEKENVIRPPSSTPVQMPGELQQFLGRIL